MARADVAPSAPINIERPPDPRPWTPMPRVGENHPYMWPPPAERTQASPADPVYEDENRPGLGCQGEFNRQQRESSGSLPDSSDPVVNTTPFKNLR